MNIIIKTLIVLLFLLSVNLNATQKQTDNISQISAFSLYNIDEKSLQSIINEYSTNHSNLKALVITESLSNEVYISMYRDHSGNFIQGKLPSLYNKYIQYKSISKFEGEKVGEVLAYYENKELIKLTSLEKKWLSENTITLSVDDTYAPMNFKNSENKMDGLSIDYIKLIEKKIGYPIKLDSHKWPIALENAMQHKTDGIINANSNARRAKKLLFTNPYITVPMVMITSESQKKYNNLNELKNKTILVKEKTIEASILPKKYPSLNVKEVKNYRDAFMFVSTGKADGVFGHMAVLEYEMNKYLMPNIKKNFISFSDLVTNQSIAIRNTAPILKNILDKAILSISIKQKQIINDRWMKPITKDNNSLSIKEIKWLKENPPITIAVVDNYPPYDFRDNNGKLDGFHTDLTRIINKNLGVNIKLKPFDSWSDAYSSVLNNSTDGIYSLSWSEERNKKYFNYSSPYHFSPYHLVVQSDNMDSISLENLSNKIIAVEKNTIFKDIVKEKAPQANILFVKNIKEAYDSVKSGDAFATISPNINDVLFKESGLKIASEVYHKSSNLYIGTNKSNPIITSIISKGVNSISLQEINSLRQKWFTKTKVTIELNDEEQRWIKMNPDVRIIEFFDEPPFTLNGNEKKGYIYELIEYLVKSVGLNLKYQNGHTSYESMISSIENGKADILTTFPTTLDLGKDSNVVASKSVLKTPFVIVGKLNDNRVQSIEDLYGKRVAVVKGYAQDHYLGKFPQIKRVYVKNNIEGFETIRSGKAEYYINNRANTEYVLNTNFATDLYIAYELPYDSFPPLSISFAMNGQKKELVSILQKALDQISYKKIKNIRDKWIIQNTPRQIKEVQFNQKEKVWLLDNPTIRLAYMQYWPVDYNGDNIHTEFAGLLSKYGNINISLVKYNAWKDGFSDAKKGKNTFGILNLSWSKEREKNSFDYSKPYFFTPGYIIVKKENKSIQSIEDLANKSVVVKENAITNQIIKDLKFNITAIQAKNEDKMYQSVSLSDSKDAALLSYVNNPELLDKYGLKIANKFFSKFGEVHLGVSKNNEELYSIINKIYKVIPKSELSRIQNKIYKKEKQIKVNLTKEEKEYIKKNKRIKVHNEKNWPPFNFYEFGQAKGYSVELMKLVAKNTGLNIEFISGPTWDEFLSLMKQDELDVIINIVKNEEREKYMIFTDPFLQATMGVAIHKDTKNIKSFNDILDKKVALEKGFFYHDYFKKNHPYTQLDVTKDGLQTLQSVAFKQSDASLGFIPVMKYIAEKNFINDLKYFSDTSSPIMESMPLRFSTRKNTPELLSILQKGLASITLEQRLNLSKRWLGNTIDKTSLKVDLTDNEKRWLDNHKNIKFTADPHYLPYEEFDKNGNYNGMVSDYLKIFEDVLDINFEKIPTNDWSESLKMAQDGKVDILSNYTVDNSLKDIHISTNPYISSPISIITEDTVTKGISLSSLQNKRIAVVKGYGYLSKIFTKYPNLNYIEVNNAREGLLGVSLGKYDAILCSLTLAKYKINALGLHNLHVAGQTGEIMNLGLGVRKDWDIFVSIMNKTINAISQGTKQEINIKWLGENSEFIKKVELTKKEQNWLNKDIPIRYVFDPDWAPFEWKNELNEHTGIIYDILRIVSERTGVEFKAVPTDTWLDAVKLAKSKEIDMYGGLGENEERKKYMNFTKNILYKTPYVFVVHKDNNNDYFDTFNSLKHNEKVAVVNGYTIEGILAEKELDTKIQTVSSTMDGFKKLTDKKIDIFLVNASTAKYYLNRKGFEELKIATKTEYNLEIKSAIRDDWPPEVLSIIDKALESITEKELADIYLKWTEVLVEEKMDWTLIYQIGGSALILILFVAYWNRRLKKAVDEKTNELQKLLESFDENVIASKTDNKGIIKYASKAFCEISGYTEDELIGSPQNIVRHPDTPKELFKDLWKTIKGGKQWRGELKNRTKDGGFYWVEAIISPEFDLKNNIVGFSAIRHDITSQKEVEEKTKTLDIQNKELEKVLTIFDDNIISSKSDLKGNIIAASKAFSRITEYSIEELIGKPHSTVRHPDMPHELFQDLWKTIQSGKVWKGEVKNLTKSGGYYWVDAVITPEFDENHNIVGYSAIRQDITSKKEVEELSSNLELKVEERTLELKESEEQFSSMAANVPGVIYRCKVDAGWTMLYISEEIKKLSGYDVDGFINNKIRTFADIMHKDDIEPVARIIQNQIDKGEKFLVDYRVISNTGEEKWVRSQGQVYSNDEGEQYLDGVLFDVTEQRALEQEIKENQEQMTYVSQFANLGFWNFNPQVGDLYVNDIFVQMLGYNADEVLVNGYDHEMFKPFKDGLEFWKQLLHPDDIERTSKILTAHINGETDLYKVEYRMRRADGSWMWSLAVGKIAEYDESGKPVRFNGVNLDIQDSKDAQKNIEDQKKYTESIMNSQSNIVISTDGLVIRTANKSFLEFFNVESKDEFLDEFGDCICDTFDIDNTGTFVQKSMDGENWIDYVYNRPNILHKTTITRDGLTYTFGITSDKFEFQGEELMVAVLTDITEIEAVRKNIEMILSNIMLPVLITSKHERKILYANEYASKQYEAPIHELIGSNIDNVYTSIEQKNEILEIMDKDGYVENLEERYKTQCGKEFIGLLSVKPILYNTEEAYIGMVVDITNQKDIEQELRRVHKHTKDSIEYAALIQSALIPSSNAFNKYFNDFFTIWQPKDIVGGDIYLFEELRNENECLLMVIDCTGHGVPGAFVTMLVKAIERQVVAKIENDKNIDVSPAWILSYFNKTMKKLLKQESDESISNAGFDGGVLYYNRKENYIKYAGAETPLFYMQNNELQMIKGNRHSIGYKKSDVSYEFDDYKIDIDTTTKVYITTDGYLDQNGGEKGFPFGKSKFKELISQNNSLLFEEQKEILLSALTDYMKDEERNDDTTVVGIEILANKPISLNHNI